MIRTASRTIPILLLIAAITAPGLGAQNCIPVVKYYLEQSGGHAPLYNGKIPPAYKQLYEGTYYLESEKYSEGSVEYNGKFYTGVLLNLNAHLDELYIRMPQYYTSSILLKQHVTSFTLGDKEFIQIKKENWPQAPDEGYYRVLYSGKDISILKKTIKRMNNTTAASESKASHVFSESNYYYLLWNGVFHSLKGKSSFLKIFRNKRSVINHFIRENKLKFSAEEKEVSYALCAAFYEKNIMP
jgi:hypothetical protein